MIPQIYYFDGDSYSRDVLPFLQHLYPQTTFKIISSAQPPGPGFSSWIIVSPTVSNKAFHFLNSLSKNHKVLLLLDWNHAGFDDYSALVATGKINLIFSPFALSRPYRLIESLHGMMVRSQIKVSENLNVKDYFFCSQPLLEDRPDLGFDQFDLMREVVKAAQEKDVYVVIKRHPREQKELPHDINRSKLVKLWEHSIAEALANYKIWYGLNSMPLYDAMALGHQVHFLRNKV